MTPATAVVNDEFAGVGLLGFQTLPEVLLYAPIGADDYTNIISDFSSLEQYVLGDALTLRGFLVRATIDRNGARPFAKAAITDGRRTLSFTSFGDLMHWQNLAKATEPTQVAVTGRAGEYNGAFSLKNARFVPADFLGRAVPRYSEVNIGKPTEVNNAAIRRLIRHALKHHLRDASRLMLERLGYNPSDPKATQHAAQDAHLVPLGFTSLEAVLEALHAPGGQDPYTQFEKAREAATRLSAYQQIQAAHQHKARPPHPEGRLALDGQALRDACLSVGMLTQGNPLSASQNAALRQIVEELRRQEPMDRLLNGDVGSGKTLCFLIPAIAAQRLGYAVVIQAPKTLLARQLAEQAVALGGHALLVEDGQDSPALDGNPILIGTVGLHTFWARHKSRYGVSHPHLLIIDEQHRFSTAQRDALLGPHTNRLEATATPVPRSLALTAYAGRAVSILEGSPVKKNIVSKVVAASIETPEATWAAMYATARTKIMETVRRAIGPECQVLFLFPAKKAHVNVSAAQALALLQAAAWATVAAEIPAITVARSDIEAVTASASLSRESRKGIATGLAALARQHAGQFGAIVGAAGQAFSASPVSGTEAATLARLAECLVTFDEQRPDGLSASALEYMEAIRKGAAAGFRLSIPRERVAFLERAFRVLAPTLPEIKQRIVLSAVEHLGTILDSLSVPRLPDTPSEEDAVRASPATSKTADVLTAASQFTELLPDQRVLALSADAGPEAIARGIQEMRDGVSNLACTTTLIQEGVTIPKLRILVVVDADKMGVADLHQLRGRLARQGGDGLFVMLCRDRVQPATLERLQAVASTTDGFVLADLDMRARGVGNLKVGANNQHGNRTTLFAGIKTTPDALDVFVTDDGPGCSR